MDSGNHVQRLAVGKTYFSEEKEGNSISKPQQVASTNTGQRKHQPLRAAVFFSQPKKGHTVRQV
jgi:hypothetical protein